MKGITGLEFEVDDWVSTREGSSSLTLDLGSSPTPNGSINIYIVLEVDGLAVDPGLSEEIFCGCFIILGAFRIHIESNFSCIKDDSGGLISEYRCHRSSHD